MANPKRRHSRSRRDKRRAHWKLSFPQIGKCPQCGEPLLPHHVCSNCGFYKGRQILTFEEEKKKSTK